MRLCVIDCQSRLILVSDTAIVVTTRIDLFTMGCELKSNKKPKYKVIITDLQNKIVNGEIAVGQMLPSQNELISEYKVAVGTVRQAVSALAAKGWVRPEKGRGVIVQKPLVQDGSNGKENSIGLAVMSRGIHGSDSNIEGVMLRILCSILQPAEKTVSYGVFSDLEQNKQRENFAAFLSQLSGLVLYYDEAIRGVLEFLQNWEHQVVLAGYPPEETPLLENVHYVYADGAIAGYLAGKVLALHGHQKVAFLHAGESMWICDLLNGFQRACDEYEIKTECVVSQRSLEEERTVAATLSKTPEITAVAVIGDDHACRFINYMVGHGVRVPEDKSVISFGSKPRELIGNPGLTRVNVNTGAVCKAAAELLLAQQSKIVHKSVPAKFEKGQTLTMLRPSTSVFPSRGVSRSCPPQKSVLLVNKD